MGEVITLVCRACGRRQPYFRSRDPGLPPDVAVILQDKCDICDDGDFASEVMLDANGTEIVTPTKGPHK
jgi:hypothetical protein